MKQGEQISFARAGKTLIRYESIIRCYIKPTLGRVVLAELGLADVKRARCTNGALPLEKTAGRTS